MRDSINATSIKASLLLPLIAVGGVSYVAPRLFRRAFAPPQRDASTSPKDLGLPEEQVWLCSVTGTRLHAWFIPVDGVRPAVIVLHGWGGNASLMLPLAEYLHTAGFHSLFLDARNHGHSEHDTFASMPRFAEDLEVAADWLADRDQVASVAVIGHSVGAGAAILSASRSSRYAAVVSVSSFAHPGEMMREQMSRMPSPVVTAILEAVQLTIGHRFETFAPRYRLPRVGVPVLLVHGDSDPVVPISDLEELHEVRPQAEVLIVPEGGHSDLAPFEPFVGEITSFLDRHLIG